MMIRSQTAEWRLLGIPVTRKYKEYFLMMGTDEEMLVDIRISKQQFDVLRQQWKWIAFNVEGDPTDYHVRINE